MARIVFPIWENREIEIATNRVSIDYNVYAYPLGVTASRTEIYNGKAYAMPGSSSICIRIADIVDDYFKTTLPYVEGSVTTSGEEWRDTYFTIEPVGLTAIEVQPIWDYTYNGNISLGTLRNRNLIRPLRNDGKIEVDYRQLVISSQQVTEPVACSFVYGTAYDLGSEQSVDLSIDLRGLAYNSQLTYNGYGSKTYDVVKSCCRYCLHYVNKIGGWDSVLMNGKNTDTEDYDRKIVQSEREEKIYHTNVSKRWNLSRVLMVDGEGLNVSEIVGSANVVLEDLEAVGSERFKKVNIETQSINEKDYSTNGNQFVNLDLVVKEVTPRVRR